MREMKDQVKLKYLCTTFSTQLSLSAISKDSGAYPVYGAAGLMGYIDNYNSDNEYLGIIKDGAGVGRIGKYPAKSSLLGTMTAIIPKEGVNIDWLKFAISSLDLGNSVDKTTIPHIYFSSYGNEKVAFPPLAEQGRIAEVLDAACSKVDALIANQSAQIEKLRAYKQSLITETVTKGLDPEAPMKHSGVDVYPYVPSHWNVQKTLTLLDMPITDGPHTTPELYPEGIPFVSAEAVSCGNGSIDFDHIRGFISKEFYDECCKKYVPQINDIYMIKSGATTGKVSVVDTDKQFTIWSPLAVFRCNPDVVYFKFLFYFLQSSAYQRQVQFGWTFGTQQNIGMRTLERLKVFVPPFDEQSAIADYLDAQCAKIDALIALKQQKIDRLGQYKKSLIYEYVTGKKEA